MSLKIVNTICMNGTLRILWVFFFTCIEFESNGASLSSLPIFATLLCTLTSAFNSFDSNSDWRNPSSCSPDSVSVSLRDVRSLVNAIMEKVTRIKKFRKDMCYSWIIWEVNGEETHYLHVQLIINKQIWDNLRKYIF